MSSISWHDAAQQVAVGSSATIASNSYYVCVMKDIIKLFTFINKNTYQLQDSLSSVNDCGLKIFSNQPFKHKIFTGLLNTIPRQLYCKKYRRYYIQLETALRQINLLSVRINRSYSHMDRKITVGIIVRRTGAYAHIHLH